ncbi:MAG: N-carbamoylputrescine amidase [Erysipelotrichaceae bacterium]|jgi:N-carbamoylputrescine amidase|nr:N-carbamoylputrescine amidase [Erysipelotrichaceae bacterium]HPY79421.1 N-carbamoylputrescine amidase [Bacilli bacterium]HQA55489.1 N-carbamoylputrescine amidase [Bacilli bacterium]
MKVKVALVQMSMSWNIEDNLKKADDLVSLAASKGANIILLPELFMTPYFCQTEDYNHFALAQSVTNSSLIKHYQELAKEFGVVLPISFFEKAGNCYFNSLVVIDADGTVIDLYRKSHIPTGQCYEEKFYFTPGDTGFKVFKTKFGVIGVGICWDQWFPEAARIMALKGAEILFYPTAIGSEPVLPKDSKAHWQQVMRGHAAANIMPVVASNRFGEEKQDGSSMTFFGSSFIADEYGNLLEEMDRTSSGVRVVEFDLEAIKKQREGWGVYRDRRIDLYQDILKLSVEDENKK